jgi:hypothetical protein
MGRNWSTLGLAGPFRAPRRRHVAPRASEAVLVIGPSAKRAEGQARGNWVASIGHEGCRAVRVAGAPDLGRPNLCPAEAEVAL